MTITTALLSLVMLLVWGWRLLPVLSVCGPLLGLELAILAASLPKVAEGAWVALLVAFMVSAVMLVWWYAFAAASGYSLMTGCSCMLCSCPPPDASELE
jgi:K+ transporter